MDKAKLIWRQKIAEERANLFSQVDLEIRDAQLADDAPALKKAVANRDKLRGISNKIDEAKTVTALKKIVPKSLI